MAEPAPRRPRHPLLVLPGRHPAAGLRPYALGLPLRGLTLQMFMIVFGLITWHLTTAQQSLIGRLAGGLFIYAISIMDAYRLAKLRWDAFQRQAS